MVIAVNPDGSPMDVGPQIDAIKKTIKDIEAAGGDPRKWYNPLTRTVVDLYAELARLGWIGDLPV